MTSFEQARPGAREKARLCLLVQALKFSKDRLKFMAIEIHVHATFAQLALGRTTRLGMSNARNASRTVPLVPHVVVGGASNTCSLGLLGRLVGLVDAVYSLKKSTVWPSHQLKSKPFQRGFWRPERCRTPFSVHLGWALA